MTTELKLPKHLSGFLHIDISEPPERIAPNLVNLASPPSARILSLSFEPQIYLKELENDDDDDLERFRPLTAAELEAIAYDGAEITLIGEAGVPVSHRAPNGYQFAVRDILAAIEETERQTRSSSDWFDGIDIHHIFFERLVPLKNAPGTFEIDWGS